MTIRGGADLLHPLPVLPVAPPTAPGLAAIAPRGDHLAQQGPRQEALAVSLVENLVHVQRQIVAGIVEEFERPDRMAKAELAGQIDVVGRADAFFDQPDRLDDEGVQNPVDGEADDVLDAYRRFA